MNQQQAYRLLDETFNFEYDEKRFLEFVKELINNSNLFIQPKPQIEPQFKDYIEKVTKFGQYRDKEGKVIEILGVKLKSHNSLERARTMQRNFIAKWLSNFDNHGAIVAFYDEEQDWRFSFVKLEYNLVKDEKGNLKAKKELTPAKRYSFLVGPNEPNHTCKKQFIELLADDKHDPLFDEIEKAFSIEKVTKEFFEEYKKRFLDLKESLEKVVKKDVVVKNEFIRIVGDDDLERFIIEFSKKLLGQIVFLYFLQKKGWLGVRKDDSGRFKEWGTGPKDFMKRLFRKEYCSYNNFFNDVLEPLFYNTLAIKRTDDFSDKFECKIPFLNGGLFEPLDGYDWMNTNINLDDDIFRGIFKTFDEFNFTVKEDEPLEKEVAVDPEMLGKVFENLLEVTDRKSKGAFYTPREIVHYMCQQSLINYLETNSNVPREDIEKFIQEGDKFLDQTIKAQEQKKKYYGRTYDIKSEYTIPKSIEKNYELLDKLLKEIKVVDPAVGSGAFPVGMMNEIVKARSILSIYFEGDRDVSELKRDCIENSLYGVDIMPSAVDICQLRFWLSLVVDELDRKKIKPLPNLDNKIMCGNSLLEEFEGVKLFDESLLGEEVKDIKPELDRIDKEINDLYLKLGQIETGRLKEDKEEVKKSIKKLERQKKKLTATDSNERNLTLGEVGKAKRNEAKIMLGKLKAKQKQFFNSYDRDTKKELKDEIEKLEWDLIKVTLEEQGNEEALERLDKIMRTKSKPFFLWKLYFAEVFQRENPGFDIVIGNPPYIKIQNIDKKTSSYFNKNYICAKGKYDIYVLFVEQSLNLMRKDGIISFIHPHRFLNVDYGEKFRNYLYSNHLLNKVVLFGYSQVFDTATTYTGIFFYKKENKSVLHVTTGNLDLNSLSFSKNSYSSLDENMILLDEKKLSVLNKIKKHPKLEDIFEGIYQGIISIGDNIFMFKGEIIGDVFRGFSKEINKNIEIEADAVKPVLKGEDIKRYYPPKKRLYVLYPHYQNDTLKTKPLEEKDFQKRFPKAYEYISQFKNNLKIKKTKYKTNPKYWYSLHRSREMTIFEQPKLMTPQLQNHPSFTFDDKMFYPDAGGYSLILKNKSIEEYKFYLAILNSEMMWFFIKLTSTAFNNGYYYFKTKYLEPFGIPDTSPEQQKPFIQLVDQILSITKDKDYLDNPDKQAKVKQLEKEIDKLVYKLYELTPEEVKIVEEFNEK